jgi:hypothetical protein
MTPTDGHQQLSDRIRICLERVEQCKLAVEAEFDERVRRQLLDLAEQWEEVAEGYLFLRERETFLLHDTSPDTEDKAKELPPE